MWIFNTINLRNLDVGIIAEASVAITVLVITLQYSIASLTDSETGQFRRVVA